jgi:hypothetical protein
MLVAIGAMMLAVNLPASAQDAANSPAGANPLQQIGNFMQNLEKQLSQFSGAAPAQPTAVYIPSPQTVSHHTASHRTASQPKPVAPKPVMKHAPMPALVPNPQADQQEMTISSDVDQNMSALQSAIGKENGLQSQIVQLKQRNSATNASKIATLTKQLNNEETVEKQVRTNITGWNNYLLSYEKYLNDASQNNYRNSGSNSSATTYSGSSVTSNTPDPIDPTMQAMQDMQQAQQNQQQQDDYQAQQMADLQAGQMAQMQQAQDLAQQANDQAAQAQQAAFQAMQ